MKKKIQRISYLTFLAFLFLLPLRIWMKWQAQAKIYTLENLPENFQTQWALVLGAAVREDGKPSQVLLDRVKTAVELYQQGKVKKLLLSGNNLSSHLYETDVMRKITEELGVPSDVIVLDPEGYHTYESCRNTKAKFGISQIVIVTQFFHLDRALYLCEAMGVSSQGISADRSAYSFLNRLIWNLRELPATLKAWWKVKLG